MTVPKKIPLRQCMGCREMKPKRELIRVVRAPEGGGVSLDFNGKKPGRGAYLCPDPACLKRVRKSRALERAFRSRKDYHNREGDTSRTGFSSPCQGLPYRCKAVTEQSERQA